MAIQCKLIEYRIAITNVGGMYFIIHTGYSRLDSGILLPLGFARLK